MRLQGIQISESGSHSSSPPIFLEASSAEDTADLEVENFLPASTGTETLRPHLNSTQPQPPVQTRGG
eukprot:scaffold15022_cov117-Isochrysis_galbana.AAC.19